MTAKIFDLVQFYDIPDAPLRTSQGDQNMDLLFGHMDDLFSGGFFDEAEALYKEVDLGRLNRQMLVAFVVTSHWRRHDRHEEHETFRARVVEEARARYPDYEKFLHGFLSPWKDGRYLSYS